MSPEEQIQALKQQLTEAQKFTALGELLGTTTHEFNNVLMTIVNYAKMGARHKDDATRDKAFAKILDAGQRASHITNSVLSMARNRGNRMEPTSLDAIVRDALLLLEREMRKYRIAIEMEVAPVPPARANGNQIQQVLLNLLINARQAMPDGGRILVRLAHDADANTVDLHVRDSGCGMPPEKLQRIFDPYYTTKSGPDETGKGGTGLGLAACRDIIDAHRGRIRVESTPGKGTAFTIKLPVAAPVPNTAAVTDATTPTPLPESPAT